MLMLYISLLQCLFLSCTLAPSLSHRLPYWSVSVESFTECICIWYLPGDGGGEGSGGDTSSSGLSNGEIGGVSACVVVVVIGGGVYWLSSSF